MGYDFKALEDGDLTIEISDYYHNTEREKHIFKVKKGHCYQIDQYGVKVQER